VVDFLPIDFKQGLSIQVVSLYNNIGTVRYMIFYTDSFSS